MAESDGTNQCAKYLKALADPLRLRIVEALRAGPLSVSDIALLLEIDIANASHHLRLMHHAGLVVTQREGKFIYYSLDTAVFAKKQKRTNEKLDFGCCRIELGNRESD